MVAKLAAAVIIKNGAAVYCSEWQPDSEYWMLAGSIEIGSNVSVIYQVRSTAQSPFCFWTIS